MSRIRKTLNSIKSKLQLNRETVTILVILLFIGFIVYSSLGGSITESFENVESSSEVVDTPGQTDIPNVGDDNPFDPSQFDPPTGINPPPGAIPDPGSWNPGGDGPSFDPPDIDPSDPGGGLPPGWGNGDPIGQPQPPGNGGDGGIDRPNLPNPSLPDFGGSDSNRSGNGINLPDRPNKAGNLYNFTGFTLFPDTSFSISFDFDFSFPEIAIPGISNTVFFILLLTLIYLPNSLVSNILSSAFSSKWGKDGEEDEEDSIFFKPQKSEVQIRREKQRQKRLQSFSDYIQHIIEQIEQKQAQGVKPKEIITWSYLTIDEAFTHFMGLKRDKDLTPLEHAQLNFESHEVDNERLREIVNLFYLTRFGNKDLNMEKVEELKDHLNNMIPLDGADDNEESRWRLF